MIEASRTQPNADRAVIPVADRLACPRCGAELKLLHTEIMCTGCAASYPIANGVLDLRPTVQYDKPEAVDWTKHWSDEKQESFAQRFFSFYRKAVFARTVRYYVSRYFAPQGVFLEAGSGTSETSMRIDKKGGARVLVALDLIRPVLEQCHLVMDERICGDIFHLPFRSGSVDGIWNVGVMEHFPHEQIDQIMREFHRVMRPGARLVMLWPATFSIPQRILRVIEYFVNLRHKGERFQFHPDEISQVRSLQQGREILSRNGFRALRVDAGVRSLMAFEILVGEKP